MRALLLGGTGAMGGHLQRELVSLGWEVYVTSRSARKSEGAITYLQGNAKDPSFLDVVLKDSCYDAVVDFMTWAPDAFRETLPSLLGSTGRYVFLSSYRVFSDSPVINESSPRLLESCPDKKYRSGSEYAIIKALEEDALRGSPTRNWTIIRPAITFSGGGAGRFQLGTYECGLWLWRAMRCLPVPVVPKMMKKQCTLTWAKDVARMIALLIQNPDAAGEDFNAATSQHQAWADVLDLYRLVLPVATREVTLDLYESHCGSALKEYGYVPQVRYDRMVDRVLDNAKVLAYTGLCNGDLADVRDALPRELSSFLARSPLLSTAPAVQGRLDRIARSSLRPRDALNEFGIAGSAKYFAGKFGLV